MSQEEYERLKTLLRRCGASRALDLSAFTTLRTGEALLEALAMGFEAAGAVVTLPAHVALSAAELLAVAKCCGGAERLQGASAGQERAWVCEAVGADDAATAAWLIARGCHARRDDGDAAGAKLRTRVACEARLWFLLVNGADPRAFELPVRARAACVDIFGQFSTRILGRRTAPFSPFLIPDRVPRGFTLDPSRHRSKNDSRRRR